MASDAGHRAMHAGLRAKLGPELAEDVIEVLAPLERSELATKSDLAEFRGDIGERIGAMAGQIGGITGQVGTIAGQIGTLTGEIRRLEERIDAQTSRMLLWLVPIMVSLAALAKLT